MVKNGEKENNGGNSGHYVVASRPPNGDRLQRRRSCQFHMYTNAKVLKFEALSSIIDAVMTSLFLKKDTF